MGETRPPTMARWNLALRFGLEVGALVGLGFGAWQLTDGPGRWIAVVAVPIVAMTAWGVFNVPDDPSRSGEAPVAVRGAVRLVLELVVLGGGAIGFVVAGPVWVGLALLVLITVHYAVSTSRLRWLLAG